MNAGEQQEVNHSDSDVWHRRARRFVPADNLVFTSKNRASGERKGKTNE